MYWGQEQEPKTLIPSNGKKSIEILVLDSPGKESVPDASIQKNNVPNLMIGETVIPDEFHNGKIIAHFAVHSVSCNSKAFKLAIEWDGKWHSRLSEMSNSLTLKMES